jgi:serine phosphatase RsbU (regulator of sigma subunit)
MQLAAEIVWNQLPPLTFATADTVVTAVLEPCYDVGGDAFDYAVDGATFHLALFDTVGHGISASALTTLAINGYRNARRCGMTLSDTYWSVDKWVRAQYPGAFVTAVLAELDTGTGTYRRICAGHPAELIMRDGRLAGQLPGPTALPLGLGHLRGRPPDIGEEALRPGDSVLLYTDGVTDARSAEGEFFGVEGLARAVAAGLADGSPPAEVLRRLLREIVGHQHGELRDDATAALLCWRPSAIGTA